MQDDSGKGDAVEALAAAVLELVAATACRQCLVWAKLDALVRESCPLGPALAIHSTLEGLHGHCEWGMWLVTVHARAASPGAEEHQ